MPTISHERPGMAAGSFCGKLRPRRRDFILALYEACGGQWKKLVDQCGVQIDELDRFLEFSGLFLSNLGNFFVSHSAHISLRLLADGV